MSDSSLTQIIEIASEKRLILVTENERSQLYDNVSMLKAQAAGLQAIAEKAIDNGDIDPDDLHNLANLSTQIKGHLGQLTLIIAELSNQTKGE